MIAMDLGDPFKSGMKIEPGMDGTFIVYVGERTSFPDVMAGFTTIDDLLIWMAKHGREHSAKRNSIEDIIRRMTPKPVTELAEGDVVPMPSGMPVRMPDSQAALSGNGVMRTTAADTLAQRVATACKRPVGDAEPQPAA